MNTTEEILKILGAVKRDGMDELINWLQDTDYFTSPASTKYHGNYEGGLADHSLNVYDSLTLLNKEFKDEADRYSSDSIAIAALLHDLCKVNTYKQDDDPASDAQVKYVKDLLAKADLASIPKDQMTKGYVSKVIEYLKNGGEEFPAFTPSWKVVDDMPLGHGEKSLFLIQQYIKLTKDEALAIRWHLGSFETGTHFFYPTGISHSQAVKECNLVPMMVAADYLASWMLDLAK
jgi:hypothetical protein